MNQTLEQWRTAVRQWFAGLQPREQWLVSRGAVVAAVLLFMGGGLQIHGAVAAAKRAVERKQDDLAYIISHLDQLKAASARTPDLETPLPALVDRTARDSGLGDQLKSNQEEGTGTVRVKFEGVAFDTLVLWLVSLQQEQAIRVENATLDRAEAGTVVATLILKRG